MPQSHVWVEPLTFVDPASGVHHMIRATGHALIFLNEGWRWHKGGAYADAIAMCTRAFESRECHGNARDAMLAALISAGLLDADLFCG